MFKKKTLIWYGLNVDKPVGVKVHAVLHSGRMTGRYNRSRQKMLKQNIKSNQPGRHNVLVG